jgi:hypothetical protein
MKTCKEKLRSDEEKCVFDINDYFKQIQIKLTKLKDAKLYEVNKVYNNLDSECNAQISALHTYKGIIDNIQQEESEGLFEALK